jgi:kexin
MMLIGSILLFILPLITSKLIKRDYENKVYYALQIEEAGLPFEETARMVAKELNMKLEGQVGELQDHFMMYTNKNKLQSRDLGAEFDTHAKIRWSEEQVPQKRLYTRNAVEGPKVNLARIPKIVAAAERDPNVTLIAAKLGITDPGFKNQWHLVDTQHIGNDMNITGVVSTFNLVAARNHRKGSNCRISRRWTGLQSYRSQGQFLGRGFV